MSCTLSALARRSVNSTFEHEDDEDTDASPVARGHADRV
jgi:hypothetical protein